jgi:hypothetical protein
MTATTMDQFTPTMHSETTRQLLQAAEAIRKYMRRVPPDYRSSALAALAELERQILASPTH